MTCVLDHDGSRFFAGTYFPDQPRHGQPSFLQVLTAISDAWRNRGGDVAQAACQIRAPPPAGADDASWRARPADPEGGHKGRQVFRHRAGSSRLAGRG